MFAYTTVQSLGWVVNQHYVVDPVPPAACAVLERGRIPVQFAVSRLIELCEQKPKLVQNISRQGGLSIRIQALIDGSLLEQDIDWQEARHLPCSRTIENYNWEGCLRHFDDWCRDFAAEREYARIAGDAIVALPKWWQ
jgi:hypothetical protein